MIYVILKWLIIPVAGLLVYLVSKINNPKTSGLITTFIIHSVLILLLFVLPGFKSDSIFPSEGLQVALGYDIDGGNSGTLAAEGSDNTNPPPPDQVSGDNSLDQEIATDDNSESNVVVPEKSKKKVVSTPKTENKTTTNTAKTETKVPERKVDQTATYKKKKGVANGNEGGDPNSNGQGGNTSGNKGDPKGSPTGNPDGTGSGPSGKGPGSVAILNGRPAKELPKINNDFEEAGILKFEVIVRPDGKVKSVRKIVPSTVTNHNQIERMKALILSNLIFTAKPDAEEEETGTYTITFVRK
ncbi:MAG: hypothetical protein NTW54_01060 [Bacteroidetes bacterium]|nr:hypothetical protein [Bacteroidota bacterium]